MNSPFSTGFSGAAVWDAFDQLRSQFEPKPASRVGRGDVRAAVLALLAERPMHGYQIIQEIEERSGGAWKPSAGSVYPTLQLLADEGLVQVEEANGRKTYALTDAGAAVPAGAAPWQASASSSKHGALPKAGLELAQATAQVGRSGSAEQTAQAVAVLDEARRKIYAILAQD